MQWGTKPTQSNIVKKGPQNKCKQKLKQSQELMQAPAKGLPALGRIGTVWKNTPWFGMSCVFQCQWAHGNLLWFQAPTSHHRSSKGHFEHSSCCSAARRRWPELPMGRIPLPADAQVGFVAVFLDAEEHMVTSAQTQPSNLCVCVYL